MKRTLVTLLALGLLAAAASAQPYYVRGAFNGWTTANPMTDDGDGTWSATIDMSAQPTGDPFQFKCATEDWTFNAPPNNAQLRYVAGNITFHFIPYPVQDDWLPTWESPRIGWDPTTGFDVMGSMNGWGDPYVMTDNGAGLFSADIPVTAGNYEFKFRATNDWEINIGQTFSWNDANATLAAAQDGLYRFELDLPNGRYRTFWVPEPASVLGLALLGLLIRRR